MYKVFEGLLERDNKTAYQVAKDTGIATATLSEWKAGNYTPKVDKLMLIADYFGVPVTVFFEKDSEETT